jgi:Niemann-Pick C1 protein
LQATFYTDLKNFLEGPVGARYQGDVSFKDDNNPSAGIDAARSEFQWPFYTETEQWTTAMDAMRSTAEEIPPPLGTNAFVHALEFLDYEQYKTIGKEAFMNIGLGFVMIGVIIVFLLANPTASILTFISVASAIVELIGFMQFRGTYIDSVTVIFLVISLGLAVDYSVHVAHGWLAARDVDKNARLEKALIVRSLKHTLSNTQV